MTFQIKNTKLTPCIQSSCKNVRHSSLQPKIDFIKKTWRSYNKKNLKIVN